MLVSRRHLMRAAQAAAVVSISARALGLPAHAQGVPAKIVIGTLPINNNITNYVGDRNFFRDAGLDVEISMNQAGPSIIQGMIAGNVVAGDIGLVPAMVAIARGLPIIAPYLAGYETPRHPFERIMVKGDSPLKTLQDLKGRKIAILGRGTVPDLVLLGLDAMPGIKRSDLEIVMLPPPNQPAALQQGVVDAIFAIPPSDIVAEKMGARTLANSTDIVPYQGTGTVIVRSDFAQAFPKQTQTLFEAWIRFARWIMDNQDAARVAVAKTLSLPESLATTVRMPMFSRNGLPVMANVWQFHEMLVRTGTIDKPDDAAAMYKAAIIEPCQRFVLPAAQAVGIDKDPDMQAMIAGEYPLLPRPAAEYRGPWEEMLLKA